jgi:hypothetical protein
MLGAGDNKSIGKSGQRNRKKKQQQSVKAEERSLKPAQEEHAKPDQLQAAQEQVSAGSSESYSTDSALADADQAGSVALVQELQEDQEPMSIPVASHESYASDDTHTNDAHTNIEEADLAASADPIPVSFQSLANAYEDYARNSFEQSRLFVEKLASVRSLDGALELQTDFVKHACEAFIAETQKIRDIQRGLARQGLAHLEQFVARMSPVTLMLPASRN